MNIYSMLWEEHDVICLKFAVLWEIFKAHIVLRGIFFKETYAEEKLQIDERWWSRLRHRSYPKDRLFI